MPRARSTRGRGAWRERHGRGIRSSVTGPYLRPLRTREDVFEFAVASAAMYLKDLWPEQLAHTRFEIAALPSAPVESRVPRWAVFREQNRVVLFRLPIEQMTRLHHDDELHRRMIIESCVFRAVAELVGRDPWDLAPDRYHPH